MHVYSARIELDLPSRTLKEKRQIIRSLLKRSRQVFNIASAEVDLHDAAGSASLGFATVSVSREHARGRLERLEPWIEQEYPDVRVVVVEIEEG